jgi:hypothetical protein
LLVQGVRITFRREVPVCRIAIGILVLSLASGCGQGEEKELKHVRTWSATAARIGELWARDEVPTRYARKALEKAGDELKDAPQAAQQIADLRSAVERGEREKATRLAQKLAQ